MAVNIYRVAGPLTVHRTREAGGRVISSEDIKKFWDENGKYAKRVGCYVFGRKAGNGWTPGYVGKTAKGFKKEVFGPFQRDHYYRFLSKRKKGTAVLFFVVGPTKRGRPNLSQIGKIEEYLIQLALDANSSLSNLKGTRVPNWGISGVLRGRRGKCAVDAAHFRKMMKIT
jgi:hypothetical protein